MIDTLHVFILGQAPTRLTKKKTRQDFRLCVRDNVKVGHYVAFKHDIEAVYLQIRKLFRNGKNSQISYIKQRVPDDDNFGSTPNLIHARIYKLLGKEILKHGVWDGFPN